MSYFRHMAEKRPIVIVGPAHPLRGGIAHFNESFARELIRQGHPVVVVSFYLQYPSILFPGKSQTTDEPPEGDLDIRHWLSSVNPLSWFRTAKRIAALRPRYVVFRFWLPFMGPALGTVARGLRKKNIPVIGLVDNAIPHEVRPMDRPLSMWFLKRCSAFATLSERVADDLRRLVPGRPIFTKAHPIYDLFGPGVDRPEALRHLGLDPKFKYVLFFGFVRKYKGLDLLAEAFASRELRDLDDVKLLIAGEFYDDKEAYLKIFDDLGIADRVILRDTYIPESQVKYYFATASIVAQTYRTATQSGVTQIAYHFGRPMLVTDVGGLAEIVPHGVVGYVSAPEAGAIARDLRRFFEENREGEFSAAVERERHNFTWDNFVREFVSFAHGTGNAD